MSAIGEIVGNEVDLEKACFQFEYETYKKPTNEQKREYSILLMEMSNAKAENCFDSLCIM
ncbi:hypothetical protein AAAC51_04605 [Priestia megaterium]